MKVPSTQIVVRHVRKLLIATQFAQQSGKTAEKSPAMRIHPLPIAQRVMAFRPQGPGKRSIFLSRPERQTAIDPSKYRFNFIGLGKFGYALLLSLAQAGFNVRGFTRKPEDALTLNQTGSNPNRFPNIRLCGQGFMPLPSPVKTTLTVPGEVAFSDQLNLLGKAEQNGRRDFILFNVPAKFASSSITDLGKVGLDPRTVIITGTKGIAVDEDKKPRLVSSLIRRAFPENPIIYLAGPSFAEGLVSGEPTFLTAVSQDQRHHRLAGAVASLIGHQRKVLFCNVHTDAVAIQLAGVLKNVFAIASGACRGLGYEIGNGLHAVLALGFREMVEFAIRAGAHPLSFQHNAALGDYYMSASSEKSRNFRLGLLYSNTWISHHRRPTDEEIRNFLGGEIAEGAHTIHLLKPILDSIEAREKGAVGFPVMKATHALLFEDAQPQRLITDIQKFVGFPHEIKPFVEPYLEF